MKIERIVNDEIVFDNGNKIGYRFYPDCEEENYADFDQYDVQEAIYLKLFLTIQFKV